jgi:L-ascorbate metabolism protein UlaG (beta-lactamase superfamily)
MINDLLNSPADTTMKRREGSRFSLLKRVQGDGANQIGLKPVEGWRKRNIDYLQQVLIPSLLKPRRPSCQYGPLPVASAEEMAVTWLGHAGFLAQIGGMNVLIDPVWALWLGPIKRVRHPSVWAHDLPRIDVVLITHAHQDHLHLPSLRKVAAAQPIIVPEGVGSLVKNCGFGRIVELKHWQSATLADLRITLTPARHWGARMIHDTHRGFGGYLISAPGHTLYHCGDSAMFDGFTEIGRRASIDLALMPIGAYLPPSGRPVHMNPEEALDAFEMVGARHMVPMHFDTYPLSGEPLHEPAERLIQAVAQRELEQRVSLLGEGESALFTAGAARV